MGDCLCAGKLSHYVTSHPGKLSLAILPWDLACRCSSMRKIVLAVLRLVQNLTPGEDPKSKCLAWVP